MFKSLFTKIAICLQLLLILVCTNLFGQKYNLNKEFRTTWSDNNFSGKVKQVTTKTYFIIEGDSLLKIWRTFTTDSIGTNLFYTSAGINSFDSSGVLKSRSESRFLYKNNIIEMFSNENDTLRKAFISNTFLDSFKKDVNFHTSERNYIYNNKGKLIKILQANNDTLKSFAADFNYDENNRLLQTTFYENKNAATGQWNYKYNDKDSLIEVEYYNYWASEYVTQKFSYPNKNKWEIKWYLNDRNYYIFERYSYNSDGSFEYQLKHTNKSKYRSKREYELDKDGISTWTKFYDNAGKLIQESTTIKKIINKFGKLDEIDRSVKTPKETRVDKIIFEYDSIGNQTKEIVYEGEKLIYQTITTYEYYK